MSHKPLRSETEQLLCGHPDSPHELDGRSDDAGPADAAQDSVRAQVESPPAASPADHDHTKLEQRIVEVLRRIYDPEIPVNIYDLGLIYGIAVYPLGRVCVRMTLTSPACPVAGSLPPEVEQTVRAVEGVTDAVVELVWDPPWSIDRMSEEARLELNLL